MLNKMKKPMGILCVLMIIIMSLSPAVLAAVSYPDGVEKQQVEVAIPKLDTAIENLIEGTENKSLKKMVISEICTDKALSSLTVSIYKMIEENADSLSTIGLKVTVSDVAALLSDYPEVQAKLSSYSSWSEASLDDVKWGIKTKDDFILGASRVLSPFNDLLYMLLCGGTYKINSVIGLAGAKGYETAIVPTLKALGCGSITDSTTFYNEAKENKTSMLQNILGDVFIFLEWVLDKPCERLSEILPGIAYYFKNGGFDKAVSTLIEPLRLQLFNISTFIKVETILAFIEDSESFTVNVDLNSILSSTGLTVAELDLDTLASCGTVSGDTVIADKADCFTVILRWLIDTLKLNKDSMGDMLGSDSEEITKLLDTLLSKSTDELFTLFISVLSQSEGEALDYTWTFGEFTPATVTYTPNLGVEKYQRVVDGADELINEFIAEGGESETVREALAPKIYSNALVTELVKGIYGAFESDDMKMLGEIIGLNVSPSALAKSLNSSFSSAKYTLSRSSKWSSVKTINWGFKDGDKDGFKKAVCAALSPLEDLITMLLAEGKISVLGSIDIYGSNGYNTAVIPLLEAIGCSADKIETYEEFKASAKKGEAIDSIVESILSLVERILDRPLYTVTELLPNLLWFINGGGIETALENLLYPITQLLDKLGMGDMLDMSSLTEDIDIKELVGDMMGDTDLGIDLDDIDINKLMTMGTLVTVESKRTVGGQNATISYIKADQPAIAVTILRFIANLMKTPGNESLVSGFMGSGDNDMFSNFSGGIGDEIAKMSVDETVEWLYKIFFRERATTQTKTDTDYLPTIIYTPPTDYSDYVGIMLFFLFAAAAEVIVILNRKKIASYLEDMKIRRQNNKKANLQEV